MKRFFSAIALLLLFANVCLADSFFAASNIKGFHRYENNRFAFSIDFPQRFSKILLLPENGDGIKVGTEDGRACITASGGYNVFASTDYYKEQYQSERERLGSKIAYSTLGDNYYAISWSEGATIYYCKQFFNNDYQNNFVIYYHRSQHDFYDDVVTQIEQSFVPGWVK